MNRATPSSAIEIAHARSADAGAIAALEIESWRSIANHFVPTDNGVTVSRPERTALWQKQVDLAYGDDYFVFTARRAGSDDIVGVCSGGGTRDTDVRGFGEIYLLHVDPAQLHEHIGSTLIVAALKSLFDAQFLAASIWTPDGIPASQSFFSHHGFDRDGSRKDLVLGHQVFAAMRWQRRFAREGFP